MLDRKYRRLSIVLWCMATIACGSQGDVEHHYSTPPGITLVDVVRERGGVVRHENLWVRLGDATGRTLFIYDGDVEPGVSACNDECAQEFPPVIARPESTAQGDWSLVNRDNGDRQWAYKNKPLYRFAREVRLNQVIDTLVAEQFEGQAEEALLKGKSDEGQALRPPEGWQVARYTGTEGIQSPSGIRIRDNYAIGGTVFTDARGMSLYAFNGDVKDIRHCVDDCEHHRAPFQAAEMSNPVGDFEPVKRSDGILQWHYRGTPLFTYSGDSVPGDVKGMDKDINGGDSRWRVPVLVQHFTPPGIGIKRDPARGKIMTTPGGKPLYSRFPLIRNYLERRNYSLPYRMGKEMASKKSALETQGDWSPFEASEDAVSSGYWEVVVREDGVRQWAYKGFLQYTYNEDKPNGSATGNNILEYVVGDRGPYKVADSIVVDTGRWSPAGLHWRLTLP